MQMFISTNWYNMIFWCYGENGFFFLKKKAIYIQIILQNEKKNNNKISYFVNILLFNILLVHCVLW